MSYQTLSTCTCTEYYSTVKRHCDNFLARGGGFLHPKVSMSLIDSCMPALVHIIYVIALDLWLDCNASTAAADASNTDSSTT